MCRLWHLHIKATTANRGNYLDSPNWHHSSSLERCYLIQELQECAVKERIALNRCFIHWTKRAPRHRNFSSFHELRNQKHSHMLAGRAVCLTKAAHDHPQAMSW